MARISEEQPIDAGVLWVGLGIGLFSVASCFALALYHLPATAEGQQETAATNPTAVTK